MKYFPLVALMLAFVVHSEGQTIARGIVADSDHAPLVSVSVIIPGTDQGTVTDANGSFTILVPEGVDSIRFSYIGMQDQKVAVSQGVLFVLLEEQSLVLDEVRVTGLTSPVGHARRRAASVPRIAESVVTFTTEHIEKTGIRNFSTFADQVPNVSYQTAQNLGVNFINVRGIGQIRNGDAPVAFLVDGVYIPDPNLVNQELFDLAMIEIVKGPQGTLYGKNAIAGAVNILTQAPSHTFRHKVKFGLGNGGYYGGQLMTTGPLVKDKIAYRLAGSYRNMDGLLENTFLDRTVDYYKDLSVRAQVKVDFNARTALTLTGLHSDSDGGATYNGHAPGMAGMLEADDFNYVIDANVFGETMLDNTFASIKLDHVFGGMVFQSITSYIAADREHFGDLDFLPIDALRQDQQSNSRSFNQEFRLGSHLGGHALEWDAGIFYQNSERELITRAYADFGFFQNPPMPTGELFLSNFVEPKPISDFTNTFETFAVFGFITYHLSDAFAISAGLRFDNDKIEQDNPNEGFISSKTDQELQPKVSLEYHPSDGSILYFNYGRGYRSGGYNAQATLLFDAEYAPETSNNFELGGKVMTTDRRLILQAAAFFIDFQNQQQFAVDLGMQGLRLGNYNFPESTVYGAELDLRFRPTRLFDLLGGFGYTESIIKDGGTAGQLDRTIFNDNHTPYVPQSTAHVGVISDLKLSDQLRFNGFVLLSNKGKIYWHENNADVSDPYNLLDARLGLTLRNKYSLSIWGRNLTDTQYYQEYGSAETTGSFAGDVVWPGQPKTFGFEIAVQF